MRKYLMTGVAALAICAAFTSCSKGGELYDQGAIDQGKAVSIVESYNQAFLKYIGANSAADIPANQTWGFGGYAAGTRSENANANEWADPNKAYGGLKVPPPLTTEQIAVVKKYFQTHPNLGYQDPGWSNYFIQQVYKGHTSVPEGCATPEQYLAANGGSYIIASDHMDHLIAVDTENGIYDHINNFNHGDCSSNGSVLTYSPEYVSSANTGPFHTDKIMYMQNSTTKSFGYYNSDGSLYHTEYTGLVSYQKIIQDMGAEANCLNDGWNRSFMGFDFEQMVGDDVYAANRQYGNWSEENNWQGELISVTYEDYHYFTFEGVKYHYLDSNRNMYAADLTEESYKQKNGSNSTIGGVADFSNLPSDDIIRDLLSKGYLPVAGSADKVWVKVGGTADGYFSDWIVTLTKAETQEVVVDPDDVCIIAEDLSATDATDFDFNDVVFTVHYNSTTTATVTLYAAGGTLPLTVAGREVHSEFGYGEVDEKGLYKMINTNRPGADGVNGVATVSFDVSGIQKSNRGNDIEILVDKGEKNANGVIENHNWLPLTATGGQPAAKLCVGADFATEHKWCDERESIKTKYPVFSAWALDNPTQIWWR